MRLSLLLAALMLLASPVPAEASELKIFLRYDDYSHASDLDMERALFEAARDVRGGILVGVIPFGGSSAYPSSLEDAPTSAGFSDAKLELLREYASRGTVEIAVHGFNHSNNAASGPKAELAGLPESSQSVLLALGMARLESALGSEVTAFIPPYNQYDEHTLQALAGSGYTLLSAGMGGPIHPDSNLTYLPRGPQPSRAEQVVAAALANGHTDATVIMTLHEYDFETAGAKDGASRMLVGELADSLKRMDGLDGVRFIATSELLEAEDLSPARLRANRKIRESFITRYRLLPAWLHAYPVADLYYSQRSANQMYLMQLLAFAVLYGALAAAATLLSWGLLQRVTGHVKRTVVVLGTLAASGVVAMLTNTLPCELFLPLAVATSCCTGIAVGGAVGSRYHRSVVS
ncbi:MAG: DUF2334 domain-containing protein [Actinobacteria bacterium]|nr:MAG: DUF2334 domain-containing protein [Actinomycetota bacterium]